MATTPTAGPSDPAILRQLERQNATLLARPQLSAAPSVNGSANSTTATVAQAVRSLAPIVSGSEVLYPLSTTSTSRDAVTINSSINNDSGDVTTVYSTNGQITVNPINQTINQYTSVDSGVNQIVAGTGVTISSTAGSGTGIVTISATGGGGNGDYGNSNVAAYLPTYTGNVGASNIRSTGNLGVIANTLTWNFTNQGVLEWPGGIGQIDTNVDVFEIRSTNGLVISTDIANANLRFEFDTDGVFTAPSNVNLLGSRLNVGPDAADVTVLASPTLIIANSAAEFIQASIININPNGSADWTAQGADSDDEEGFSDLGFAGHSFNDPNFTITEPGDGYVFSQGYANGIGGSLVLATGENGNVTDIVFATGGFLANNEFARIDHANDVFHLTRANSGIQFSDGSIQTTAAAGAGGLPLANGNSNFNIANANGNATVTTAGTQTWTFDTNGNVTIPGSIIGTNTIEIDNRASGNTADINLYSADDITLQARDRPIGATAEGGDINIFAGDSAEDSDTSGGDVIIEAGAGGASNLDFGGSGGFVRVEAGQGGAADGANISALDGGSLTLSAGDAGGNGGNIALGASGGDVTINAGDSTGNGEPGGDIILRSGDAGANALAGQIQLIISGGDVGPGGTWTFDGEGIIQLPNSGTIGNDGNNIDIGSSNAISLEASSAVNIYTDTGTAAWQWQFQDDGNLRLPTIELDVGNTINEQTVIQSQRKIIPGLRYSVEIDGSTPTTVYTATSIDTTAMKVTMQIQHQSLGIEFFDVSATSSGSDTYYTVSNRLQPPGITDSTVVVDFNGSNIMEITVTINSGATTSWVTYDAVEFGIPLD